MKFYPLAPGNTWEYQLKDGTTYTNTVVSIDGNIATLQSNVVPAPTHIKLENGTMYNELVTPGNYQLWLKDDLQQGETWEASFTANGLDSILVMTVKESGMSKEVGGKTYNDVLMVEAESKISMNGNLMSTNFFTQYYYAKNVGLILTTSSMGDEHALQSYSLN
jgi:hypothetical protein